MVQIEEANADIAIAMARLDDEDMDHFSPQKSAKIKRVGYIYRLSTINDISIYKRLQTDTNVSTRLIFDKYLELILPCAY